MYCRMWLARAFVTVVLKCAPQVVVECAALRVLSRCRGDDEMGDESNDEVQRPERRGGEHAAEMNAHWQVDP